MNGDHMFSGPMLSAPHRLRAIPRPRAIVASPLAQRLVGLVNAFDDLCQQLDSARLGDGGGKAKQGEVAKRGEVRRLGPLRTTRPGLVALQAWALARKVAELETAKWPEDTAKDVGGFVRTWSDQYEEMEIGLRKCVPPPVMDAFEECLAKIGESWEQSTQGGKSNGP